MTPSRMRLNAAVIGMMTTGLLGGCAGPGAVQDRAAVIGPAMPRAADALAGYKPVTDARLTSPEPQNWLVNGLAGPFRRDAEIARQASADSSVGGRPREVTLPGAVVVPSCAALLRDLLLGHSLRGGASCLLPDRRWLGR
jgi:hypothetical protein